MSLLQGTRLQSRINRLRKGLEKQRAALVKGRIDAIVPHTKMLEDVLSQIEGIENSTRKQSDPRLSKLLQTCRKTAAENLSLLKASQRGIAAARAQLQSINSSLEQLSTYSGTGERRNLIKSAPRMEKRS